MSSIKMAKSRKHLHALVDMGSNGIRFSISNLSPPTARVMPTLFQDRTGISLYDAQYNGGAKGPIPAVVIKDVIASLQRFKIICDDFGVPKENVKLLATEATRTAENSVVFLSAIKDSTGWEVTLLPKEDEGRVGAMGIASSFSSVKGLVMDLGGGSTQISWMMVENGDVKTGGSMSLPYGAAAMTRRLLEALSHGRGEVQRLRQEVTTDFQKWLTDLQVPPDLVRHVKENDGYSLYLSGGGFRGWGYLLMDQHRINPYPIPIINGFEVSTEDFRNIGRVQSTATNEEVFRVSARRASQIPAVAFLIECLTEAIPNIRDVRFCQGGVREGFLYGLLSDSDLLGDPLETAALPFSNGTPDFGDLLIAALPKNTVGNFSCVFRESLIRAFSHLLFVHSSLPKEGRAPAALRSTTTGILASAHGVSHSDRALLGLLLCERWGGEVAPTDEKFKQSMARLVSAEQVFYTKYLGSVAELLGQIYPAGIISTRKVTLEASETTSGKGVAAIKLALHIKKDDPMTEESVIQRSIEKTEKVGKKKNWITRGSKEVYGRTVLVEVERDLA